MENTIRIGKFALVDLEDHAAYRPLLVNELNQRISTLIDTYSLETLENDYNLLTRERALFEQAIDFNAELQLFIDSGEMFAEYSDMGLRLYDNEMITQLEKELGVTQ